MKRILVVGLCVVAAVSAHASQRDSQKTAGQPASVETETETEIPILGRLIGLWDVSMVSRNLDGSWPDETLHRLWRWYPILNGQAIQDDWIRLDAATDGSSHPSVRVTGTNIRIFNPETEEWSMAWIDTLSRKLATFTATNVEDTVVMTGRKNQGRLVRITFSNITAEAFEWTQDWTSDDGETWFPVARMQCRRLK